MSPDRGATPKPWIERSVVVAFAVCGLSALGLGAVYWRGGDPQFEGALLFVAFGSLGYGLVAWGKHLLSEGPITEERHDLGVGPEFETLEEDAERSGGVERRKLLRRALVFAAGGLATAFLFPIRSLGPNPGNSLVQTPWRRGLRLVTDDGSPVRAEDVPVGGLVTVFPETDPGSADGQAVLIRVADPSEIEAREGREDWSPEGLVAYSKVCTHAGCPVGLYQRDRQELLCPCHQSTFDVLRGAEPTFGPAAAALPQLPLRLTADGFLEARGEFSGPVGPAFWRRT